MWYILWKRVRILNNVGGSPSGWYSSLGLGRVHDFIQVSVGVFVDFQQSKTLGEVSKCLVASWLFTQMWVDAKRYLVAY